MVFDGVGIFAFFDRFAEVILIRKLLLDTQLTQPLGHWRMRRSGREVNREECDEQAGWAGAKDVIITMTIIIVIVVINLHIVDSML